MNTYGAFGSVTRQRFEIVLEGTADDPASPAARWVEYEFPCKPGAPSRRPCWISPYHERLDWQMWFLAMPGAGTDTWFLELVAKLLEGDPAVRGLLAPGAFEGEPPARSGRSTTSTASPAGVSPRGTGGGAGSSRSTCGRSRARV